MWRLPLLHKHREVIEMSKSWFALNVPNAEVSVKEFSTKAERDNFVTENVGSSLIVSAILAYALLRGVKKNKDGSTRKQRAKMLG